MHSLTDYRGKKVLLYCWASWRGCRHDLPVWQGIYEETRDKGFVILGIALDIAGEAVVREFIRPAAAGDMPQAIQDIMGLGRGAREAGRRADVSVPDRLRPRRRGTLRCGERADRGLDRRGGTDRPAARARGGERRLSDDEHHDLRDARGGCRRQQAPPADLRRCAPRLDREGREERACALARRGPVADGGPDTERGSRGCPLPGWRASSPVREAGRRPATPRRGGPPPPRELELPPAGNSTLRSGALRLGRGYAGVLAGRDVARRRTLLSADRDEGNAAALPVSARLSDLAKAGPSRLNRCRTVRCALRRRQLKSAVRACLG